MLPGKDKKAQFGIAVTSQGGRTRIWGEATGQIRCVRNVVLLNKMGSDHGKSDRGEYILVLFSITFCMFVIFHNLKFENIK